MLVWGYNMKFIAISMSFLFFSTVNAAISPIKNKTLFPKKTSKKASFSNKENLDFVFKKAKEPKQMQQEKVSIKIEEKNDKKK